jgi:hypothetical protein
MIWGLLSDLAFSQNANVPTTMTVGCLTLIVGLGSRNLSISDRARSNAKQIIEARDKVVGGSDNAISPLRMKSLRDQNAIFRERYTLNQIALALQYGAVPCFIVTAVFQSTTHMQTARIAFLLGALFLAYGLILTAGDIFRAQRTLIMEIECANDLWSEVEPKV